MACDRQKLARLTDKAGGLLPCNGLMHQAEAQAVTGVSPPSPPPS